MKIDIETLKRTKGIGDKTLERIIEQHKIDHDIVPAPDYEPSEKYRVHEQDMNLWLGDCIDLMKHIPTDSVDMVFCDLPYGTTQNNWDNVIPWEPLWEHYQRVVKDNGAIILTGSGRFTNSIINNLPVGYKWYDLVWDKKSTTGFLNASRQPLRRHEDVLVIYKESVHYTPIKETRGKPRNKGSYNTRKGDGDMCYGAFENVESFNNTYYPTSILEFSNANQKEKQHPTEKPVELVEYLINTYSKPGDMILDNAMGGGTSALAAKNTGRKFIGIEIDEEYYNISKKRIIDEN